MNPFLAKECRGSARTSSDSPAAPAASRIRTFPPVRSRSHPGQIWGRSAGRAESSVETFLPECTRASGSLDCRLAGAVPCRARSVRVARVNSKRSGCWLGALLGCVVGVGVGGALVHIWDIWSSHPSVRAITPTEVAEPNLKPSAEPNLEPSAEPGGVQVRDLAEVTQVLLDGTVLTGTLSDRNELLIFDELFEALNSGSGIHRLQCDTKRFGPCLSALASFGLAGRSPVQFCAAGDCFPLTTSNPPLEAQPSRQRYLLEVGFDDKYCFVQTQPWPFATVPRGPQKAQNFPSNEALIDQDSEWWSSRKDSTTRTATLSRATALDEVRKLTVEYNPLTVMIHAAGIALTADFANLLRVLAKSRIVPNIAFTRAPVPLDFKDLGPHATDDAKRVRFGEFQAKMLEWFQSRFPRSEWTCARVGKRSAMFTVDVLDGRRFGQYRLQRSSGQLGFDAAAEHVLADTPGRPLPVAPLLGVPSLSRFQVTFTNGC